MGSIVKVVVADDDLYVARFIARVMASLGYCAILCSDGERALHVLEDNPDARLLVTDISMPNMDGRRLLGELRSRENFKKLPVILTSGLARVSEIADLLDVGVTCYLGKPIEVDELRSYAQNLVQHGTVVAPK
ncbi:MAG: response regulator [Candidatus Hydrogenedentes bacterium]|nr:response regulator [Candidatus Hydrogenedentota bacterium]